MSKVLKGILGVGLGVAAMGMLASAFKKQKENADADYLPESDEEYEVCDSENSEE